MSEKATQIKLLIDTTISSYYKIFDEKLSDKRASIIILAIIGDLPYNSVTREIIKYCKEKYNFNQFEGI